MSLKSRSRIFANVKFLDKMMFPIALKGVQIADFLRIVSIGLLGLLGFYNFDNFNEVYIRNTHIIILFSILYTIILYIDDRLKENPIIYFLFISLILMNISVIFNYSPDMSMRTLIATTDSLSLYYLTFSFFFIRDKHFYSYYLNSSRIASREEKILACTKSLSYGKNVLEGYEIESLLAKIKYNYENLGYINMAEYSNLAKEHFVEYNKYLELVTNNTIGFQVETVEELINVANFRQNEIMPPKNKSPHPTVSQHTEIKVIGAISDINLIVTLSRELKDHHVRLEVVSSYLEIIEKICQEKYDLILITNYGLSAFKIPEIVKLIRAIYKIIPIVIVVGKSMFYSVKELSEDKLTEIITSPFEGKDLVEIIKNFTQTNPSQD